MPVVLYLDLLSQPCRALQIFSKMNDIDYEHKGMSLVNGDHKSEWFTKLTPMGAVPLLEDGDYVLTESMAILRYLSNKFPVADHWYPVDIKQRGRVDEYLSWHYCPPGLRLNAAKVFMANSLIPKMTGKPTDRKEVQNMIEILNPVLDRLENYFLSRGEYIAGTSDVTIADLFAICELMQPASIGFDVTTGRPKLKAWMERVKGRLQPYFDEAQKNVFDVFSEYKI